jgi:hypothetical protein
MTLDCIQPLALPASQQHILRKKDLLPSNLNETRRFPRRFAVQLVELHCLPTFPALNRLPGTRTILLVDLSRGGVRFFAGDQMYPGESVSITIGDRTYTMEVTWCSRMDSACFQVGAKFSKTDRD